MICIIECMPLKQMTFHFVEKNLDLYLSSYNKNKFHIDKDLNLKSSSVCKPQRKRLTYLITYNLKNFYMAKDTLNKLRKIFASHYRKKVNTHQKGLQVNKRNTTQRT